MTILMIKILSIHSKTLLEETGWLEWFKALPGWQSFALFIGCALAMYIFLLGLAGDWLVQRLEEWKEYVRNSRLQEEADASLRREQEERERTTFYAQPWGRKEAALALKKYHRESERRDTNIYGTRYMPHLSDEEIHQRIDFLEELDFEQTEERLTLSEADRRIACRKHHDEEREKELRELTNAFLDDAERVQEEMAIINYWNDKKRRALLKIGGAERKSNVTA
jgi:hypothetical protein